MNCYKCGISLEEEEIKHIEELASNDHMCEKARNFFKISYSGFVCKECWNEFLDSGWEFE